MRNEAAADEGHHLAKVARNATFTPVDPEGWP
jgi:hypothetical protein